MARRYPPPAPPGFCLHFIGDLHFSSLNTARTDKVLADLARPNVPTPAAHFQCGDATNDGTAAQDAAAAAWLDSLPAPWYATAGNHDWGDDHIDPGDPNYGRTPDAAVQAWGQAASTFTVEFEPVNVIVLGPSTAAGETVSAADLNYLGSQLAAAGAKPCIIVHHYPLYDTHGGDSALDYTSTATGFYARTDASIRGVLAEHANAVAWVSGHTHTHIHALGFVDEVTVGAHTLLAVNTSSLWYQRKSIERHDPIQTVFLSIDDGDLVVRVRDHGAHAWVGPAGVRAVSFALA